MIYLDYNATTPTDPTAVDAMIPYLREYHGNPSSTHAMGAVVKEGVTKARGQVARLLGASPDEIVFTSSGSESNNHILKGVADTRRDRGDHIIISAVEHPAVQMPCGFLESKGLRVTRVGVDGCGMVDPDEIRKALTDRTILISIMHANNEVGTIQPLAEISKIAREADVWFHTDAAQSVGKIPTKVNELGVDFLSLAGHKVYAPLGVGALYVRSGIEIEPLIHGAGHEKGRRAGTEAVPNVVALGAAAELAYRGIDSARIRALCVKLHELLVEALDDRVVLNGHPEQRLPNTLNVGFRGLIGVEILARLSEVAASPGAACHFSSHEPSPVLAAMNVPRDVALGAIRFSLGRPTTETEIERAAEYIVAAIRGRS